MKQHILFILLLCLATGVLSAQTRDVTSIRANSKIDTTVLTIIDGVVDDSTSISPNGIKKGSKLEFVDPEDIETIRILKGKAATDLYGDRGKNGVIAIVTKKGKSRKSKTQKQ